MLELSRLTRLGDEATPGFVFICSEETAQALICATVGESLETSMDWITDRLPTREEADKDGDVYLQMDPEAGIGGFVGWDEVKLGEAWMTSENWYNLPENN